MSCAKAVEISLTHRTAAGIAGTYKQDLHFDSTPDDLIIYIRNWKSPNIFLIFCCIFYLKSTDIP
jgi:hypothetical protein